MGRSYSQESRWNQVHIEVTEIWILRTGDEINLRRRRDTSSIEMEWNGRRSNLWDGTGNSGNVDLFASWGVGE